MQHYLDRGEKECVLTRHSVDNLCTNVARALKLSAQPWKFYWGRVDSAAKPTRLTDDTFSAMLEAYDKEPSEISIYAYLPTDTEKSPSKPPAAEDTDVPGPLPIISPPLSSPRAPSETGSSRSSASSKSSGWKSRSSAVQTAFSTLVLKRHGQNPCCAICGVAPTTRQLQAAHIIAHSLFGEDKDTAAMEAIDLLGPDLLQNGILLCQGFCHHFFDNFYLTVVADEDGELIVEIGEQLRSEVPMYAPLHGRRLMLPPQAKLKPLNWPSKDVWKLAEKLYRDAVASWDEKKRLGRLAALRKHPCVKFAASTVAAGAAHGGAGAGGR